MYTYISSNIYIYIYIIAPAVPATNALTPGDSSESRDARLGERDGAIAKATPVLSRLKHVVPSVHIIPQHRTSSIPASLN